jgi:hypothetical protein
LRIYKNKTQVYVDVSRVGIKEGIDCDGHEGLDELDA